MAGGRSLRVLVGASSVLGGVVWNVAGVAPPVALAAPPAVQLTADIETVGEGSGADQLTVVGSSLFFTADDGVHGDELWVVTGTGTPTLVADIYPGGFGSQPRNLTDIGGVLWFTADDGVHGSELWTSDGTPGGTAMVADINPFANSSSDPGGFTAFDGAVYFAAADGVHGREVWKSNGTAPGTTLAADLRAAGASSNPGDLTVVDYTSISAGVGPRLWLTAETAGGAASAQRELVSIDGGVTVDPVVTAVTDRAPRELVTIGTSLYLVAEPTSTTTGFDPATIHQVTLAAAGPPATFTVTSLGGTSPFNLTPLGSTLYFTARSVAEGEELFRLAAGVPTLVADIRPGALGSSPAELTAANAVMYFTADDGTNGRELWRVVGATNAVTLVADLWAGPDASLPVELRTAGNAAVIFSARTGSGREPWLVAGANAPVLVEDIAPGADDSSPQQFHLLGTGSVWFIGTDPAAGAELMTVAAPIVTGTVTTVDIRTGTAGSFAGAPGQVGPYVVWSAHSAALGDEPRRLDTRTGVTTLLADLNPGPAGSASSVITPVGDGSAAVFFADDGVAGSELWRTDGTPAGTTFVEDINPTGDAAPSDVVPLVHGGIAYFPAFDGANGRELWRTDGTAAGTFMVKDVVPGAGGLVGSMAASGARVYFETAGPGGDELWWTDGTAAGTVEVDPTADGPVDVDAVVATPTRAFFVAADPTRTETVLWTSDGTAAGTAPVQDLGTAHARLVTDLVVSGSRVFWFAENSATGDFGLWTSDGTAAGTVELVHSPTFLTSTEIAPVDGGVLFAGGEPATGIELWRSRGTPGTTSLVVDLVPGAVDGNPLAFTALNGFVYFHVTTPAEGRELWRSDGVTTERITDLTAGVVDGVPLGDVWPVGDRLFFRGITVAQGDELWYLADVPPVPSAPAAPVATAGSLSATVTWAAVVGPPGAPVTGYTVTASPGGGTCTTAATTCTVAGLAAGTSYTFTVVASNRIGSSAVSPASNAVVPLAPAVVTVLPARVLETRVGDRLLTADGAFQGIGRRAGDSTLELTVAGRVGVPLDAAAVMVNVTAVAPDGPGFVTVFPCGGDRPNASSVNYAAGQVVPNAVLAKVGANGAICLYTTSAADLLVDVNGYVPAGGSPVTVLPARLLETRSGPGAVTVDGQFQGVGRVAAGGIVELLVAGRGNVPANASAVMLNVTAVAPDGAGFVTVFPCGRDRPLASSVNYQAGQVVPNAVLAQVGANGTVCVFTTAAADLLVDVNGFVPAGSAPTPVVPARLLETRSGLVTVDGQFQGVGRQPAGSVLELPVAGRGNVPAGASAVMVNVTAVVPGGPGFLTVFPCGQTQPGASSVNYQAGQVVPNAVLAKIGTGGKVCLFTLAATDLLVDVTGWT